MRRLVLSVVLLAFNTPNVIGAIFFFEGRVSTDLSPIVDQNNELDGSIVDGTILSGWFSFDLINVEVQGVGRYIWHNEFGDGSESEIEIGNYRFQNGIADPSGQITIEDDNLIGATGFIEDAYTLNTRLIQQSGPEFPLFVPSLEPQASFTISLQNRVNTADLPSDKLDAITSTDLSPVPPDIELFDRKVFLLHDGIGTKSMWGIITSLTATPEPDPLIGDTFPLDGVINIKDVNNVRNHFGNGELTGPPINGDTYPFDGKVDLGDLDRVRNFFGAGTTAVPEPSTLALASLFALVGIIARRRRS